MGSGCAGRGGGEAAELRRQRLTSGRGEGRRKNRVRMRWEDVRGREERTRKGGEGRQERNRSAEEQVKVVGGRNGTQSVQKKSFDYTKFFFTNIEFHPLLFVTLAWAWLGIRGGTLRFPWV